MTIEERIAKARTLLLLDQPFFGTLSMQMEQVIDPTTETAATNGRAVKWNPDFVAGLSDKEVQGVLAHEVLHVANGHVWRRGGRDHSEWNEATDFAINHIVLGAGLTLPSCALNDPAYAGQAAEEIYSRRHQSKPPSSSAPGQGDQAKQANQTEQQREENAAAGSTPPSVRPGQENPAERKEDGKNGTTAGRPDPGQPSKQDPGGCGAVEDAPADEDLGQMAADWKVAISQAAMAARAQGNLPAGLERLVDELLNPKVAWEVLLRDFVERSAHNDYAWQRPNRRYLSQGIILPSLVSEELPAVVVAIDTSGSIGKETLDQFAAEVSAVLGAYETTIHLVYCDAQVHGAEVLTRADLPLKLRPQGGGGTDFRPVFNWVRQQGIEPAACIYLTDTYGTFPDKDPGYPVLWISTTKGRKAPFGDTVEM